MTRVWQNRPLGDDEDRVPCRVCGGTAYDLSDAFPFPPCSHGEALCGDCVLGEHGCTACQEELDAEQAAEHDAAHKRAWAKFRGDPFLLGPREADPWGPLAAESRADNDRFWSTVGDRSTEPREEA